MTQFLTVAWALLLLIGSLLPLPIKVHMHITRNHHFIHPAVHIGSFALLAFLLVRPANSPRGRFWALLASLSFGILLELLEQRAGKHQPLEVNDICLDAYGAAFGFLAIMLSRHFSFRGYAFSGSASESNRPR